jgi:transcriptional regulator CtsR
MNIITVFAGRKSNLEILNKYLKDALKLKIIDEVHYWNNTRNNKDEGYLKTLSNLKRTSSNGGGNYIKITPVVVDNSFELSIKATNDIHIQLSNEYEIVLGGWHNTMSMIRENGKEIHRLVKNNVAENTFNNFQVKIVDNVLNILKNGELIMSQKICDNFQIEDIFFKTGHGSVGHLNYETTENDGIYFMDTCEKSWRNYYEFYERGYENDIIMKCDDDIVFIDLFKLPNFIEFVRNNDYDLVFANTINNGVSAFYQQDKYNLIPDTMKFEYPNGGFCGSLWESGKKAECLHNYFIENHEKFLNYDYKEEIIPIYTRFSINFFGYKGSQWHKISKCFTDDEHILTVDYVVNRGFQNVLYSDFYVSHLSFYKQNGSMNLEDLYAKYNQLYDKILR